MAMIVVKCTELRIGDMIHMCGHSEKISEMSSWSRPHTVLEMPVESGISNGKVGVQIVILKLQEGARVWERCTYYSDQFFYVDRGLPGEAQISISSPQAAAWNGKCPTCGKNVYVGFLKTEHEGGSCR